MSYALGFLDKSPLDGAKNATAALQHTLALAKKAEARLCNPHQEDVLVNRPFPERRHRDLIEADYVGQDFRSNLELSPLSDATVITAARRA